eukprot:2898487-Pleurochrysis_carterae.AAC.1
MAEDRVGWSAAERAEIANHHTNRSWTYMGRSDVPPGRTLVRLIWVRIQTEAQRYAQSPPLRAALRP